MRKHYRPRGSFLHTRRINAQRVRETTARAGNDSAGYAVRYSAARCSMRAARPAGPAEMMLRLSLATTCEAT